MHHLFFYNHIFADVGQSENRYRKLACLMHSLRSCFKKKVFANATGMIESGSSKFRELMTYLVEEKIGGELTARIDARLQEARRSERMRARYMTLEWELASKYREGREEL